MKESAFLRFFYHTPPGRLFLRLLTCRWVSRLYGHYLDSRLSRHKIKRFIRKNNIDLTQFEQQDYRCFNDCFCRKIKSKNRPIDMTAEHLIAPCDGLLSAYPVRDGMVLPIKQSHYSVSSLLENEELAERYRGGVCLVFRLCVNHYHRYSYIDSGTKGENIFIPGKLHTVRPIALESLPVFIRNCREYTEIETDHFGHVVQMEVGALLVGKIQNHDGAGAVTRGAEKGLFLYGGSTIVVLLEQGRAEVDSKFFQATEQGEETPVVLGQQIGKKRGD